MKNLFLTLFAITIFTTTSFAQIGINSDSSSPSPSAMLDIKSSDKGLLIPRMSTIERNAIQNPEIGLMVFDKDLQELFIYNSDGWKQGTMSKLPLELIGNKLNILKVINTNTNSYPTTSSAAEFKTNDILGIAVKAESSSNLPTIDARNNIGTAIEGVSNNGIGGAFTSISGTAILGSTGDNHAFSGTNNSFTIPTVKFTNIGGGLGLDIETNGSGAKIKSQYGIGLSIENLNSYSIYALNNSNTFPTAKFINNGSGPALELNNQLKVLSSSNASPAIYASAESISPTLNIRATGPGPAVYGFTNTSESGYFESTSGRAVVGSTGDNHAFSGSNNSSIKPTVKFINNGGGPAMELNSELNINTTRLTGGLNIKNNLIGNNGNFGSAVNIELTGGPGRALVVQSNGSNSHAIWGVATDSGIGVVGNSTNSLGGNFQSINGAGMQVSANNNNAIQGFNNSTNFPTAWFQNYFGNGSLALRLDGNLEINGKILNEAYQTPTFENSWANFGGEWNTAKFYKGKDGRVYLEGVVTGGSSSVICTLPVGYRPASRIFFIVSHDGNGRGRIDIQANGVVSFDYGANRTQVGLDGISFRVD